MSDYTINDLRGDLAETIGALRRGDEQMSVDKAKAIGDLAQTMINTAKVEVDMLKTLGRGRMQPTGFLAIDHKDTLDEQGPAQLPAPNGSKPKPHIYNPVGSGPRGAM